MANTITKFFRENQRGMITGGIVGGVTYFLSKNFLVTDFSTLQSGLTVQGLTEQLGITLEIKTLLFFIVFGVIIGMFIDMIWKKK